MLLTRAQATLSEWEIRKKLASGEWRALFPGIYWTLSNSPLFHSWCRASLLWAGREAALCGETAAILHGLDGEWRTEPVCLAIPPAQRRRHAQTRVRRVQLSSGDVTIVDELRCTTVTRTLVDLARTTDPENLALAFESAWRRDHRVPEFIRDLLPSLQNDWGLPALRAALADTDRRKQAMDSALEVKLWRFLRERRFPLPVLQYPVADDRGEMFIDFAYPSRGIALETDGYSAHGGRKAFDQDALRRGRLMALGMIHLSVTNQQLTKESDALDRRLRTILASRPERRLRPVLAEVFVTPAPTEVTLTETERPKSGPGSSSFRR